MSDYLPTATLGELVSPQSKKVFTRKDPARPYVGLEQLGAGEPRILDTLSSTESVSVNSEFETGDILFGKLRPNLRKCVPAPFPGYCSTDILVLRPRPGVNPRFAGYMLQSEQVFQAAVRSAVGTKMPRTNWPDLQGVRVFAPKEEIEQAHIAEFLDALDTHIQYAEGMIAKLRKLKAGLFYDLLTRGLDEHGRIRDPIRNPGEFRESPLGRIPISWKSPPLVEILREPPRNGYSPVESPEFLGGFMLGLGCLTPNGFSPCQLKYAPMRNRKLCEYLLKDGDLLLSRSNTRELVALAGTFCAQPFPCFYPDLMMRLRPKPKIKAQFLEVILRHPPVRKQLTNRACGTSGSMVKVNAKDVEQTIVAFPKVEEQDAILAIVDEYQTRLSREEQIQSKLRSIKRGLAQDLLTGRVRVKV